MEAEQEGFLGKQKSLLPFLLQLFLNPSLVWFLIAFVCNEMETCCFVCSSLIRSGSSGMENGG